jgi:NAD(P)H-flavin reductase
VIIVAGGLGLAPLRPLLYEIMERRNDFARVVLLVGARSPDLLLYGSEIAQWSQRGIEVQETVDRAHSRWTGNVGVVPLLLDRLKPLRPENSVVLMCGPEVMMHYGALSAVGRGIPTHAIWLSLERNMQCAVGLCGHCQLGPAFVCREGPVLRYDVIAPLLKVRDL